jgi:hypothetical protein
MPVEFKPMSLIDSAVADLARFRNVTGSIDGSRGGAPTAYTSKLRKWEQRAAVRTQPRRVIAPSMDVIFFPPELFPPANHPLVAERGPDAVRRLLVHRLYSYMDFTIQLEQFAVLPVCTQISRARAGVALPGDMRMDAFKISTDEAWHAQFSFDMLTQVQECTSVPASLPDVPQFIVRIDQIRRQLDADLHGVDRLVFSIISETLISRLLSDLPRDHRLPEGVRELVADHAEDERRHHAYFTDLLSYIWPALSRDQQRRIGPWIPAFIFAFMEPDYLAAAYALHEIGLTSRETEQVIAESYPAEAVRRSIAGSARATVRNFMRVGALRDSATEEAFAGAGLLAEGLSAKFALDAQKTA